MTSAVAHLFDLLRLDSARAASAAELVTAHKAWPAVLDAARRLDVSGLLALRVANSPSAPVPEGVRQTLRDAARSVAIRNLKVFADVRLVVDALRVRKIEPLVLKGPHLTAEVYRHMSARRSGDLDVLVRWRDLDLAAKAIEAIGYRSHTPYHVDSRLEPYLGHQLPPFVREGATPVELHWTIGTTERIDVDGLWQRAVPARMSDRDVLVLGPEDLLVHLCGHAAHHHAFECGARPLCDIAATIHHYRDLDWRAVISRSRAWGWARANALVLQMAKTLVGANVPDAVITDLCPEPAPEAVRAIALDHLTASADELAALYRANLSVTSLANQGLAGKLRVFARAAFPSPTEMARRYPVSPASPLLVAYYPRRVVDVLRRHWRQAWHLHAENQEVTRLATAKATLHHWLNETSVSALAEAPLPRR